MFREPGSGVGAAGGDHLSGAGGAFNRRLHQPAANSPTAEGLGHTGVHQGEPARALAVDERGLLAVFALLYLAIGIFAFEPLLEES